jgi:hypothetical protein
MLIPYDTGSFFCMVPFPLSLFALRSNCSAYPLSRLLTNNQDSYQRSKPSLMSSTTSFRSQHLFLREDRVTTRFLMYKAHRQCQSASIGTLPS